MPEITTIGAAIKETYEAQPNTNAFTNDEKSKLENIETGAQKNTVLSVNGEIGNVLIDLSDSVAEAEAAAAAANQSDLNSQANATLALDYKNSAQDSSNQSSVYMNTTKGYRDGAAAIVMGFTAGSVVGFATLSALNADLTWPANTVAWVMNDPTVINNGTYRKVGATNTGSWVQASTDRLVVVEGKVTVLQSQMVDLQTQIQSANNPDFPIAIMDVNDRMTASVNSAGKLICYSLEIPTNTTFTGDATPISQKLMPAALASSFEVDTSIQYALAVVDVNNNMKFAVPLSGNIIGKIQNAVTADTIAAGGVGFTSLSADVKSALNTNETVAELIGSNLYTHNRITGQRILISNASPTYPVIFSNSFITYFESSVWKYKPITDGTAWPVLPNTRLTTWGDSLTADSRGISASAAYLGQVGLNRGASGYAAADIAIRQGGLTVYFNAVDNQIPASGSVALTLVNSPTTGYRTGSIITFSGSLVGVAGTLTKAANETWSFIRTNSGSTVACPPVTAFVCLTNNNPADGGDTENDIQSIWIGRNNVGSATFQSDVVNNVARMAAYIKPLYKRYVVISITNGTTEGIGTTNYNNIIACNQQLALIYQGLYYDLRSDFIQNGLATVGITPTADDIAAIADDRPPPSLMSDSIHPNANGYNAQKILFANYLTSKGCFL